MSDDLLVKKCLSNYNSVRNTFEDLQCLKSAKKESWLSRLLAYVLKTGGRCYRDVDELKERKEVLVWLMINLCKPRHLRQKQLLILGVPGTNKTNLVQALSEFLDVYFVSRRPNDFTGAEKKEYDLWVIDEFSGYTLSLEMLNMLLDSQKMLLDTKYGKMFEKTRNVPIIMLGNSVPLACVNEASFESRVLRVYFFSESAPLEASRLASTLLSLCIRYHSLLKPRGAWLRDVGLVSLTDSELLKVGECIEMEMHIETWIRVYYLPRFREDHKRRYESCATIFPGVKNEEEYKASVALNKAAREEYERKYEKEDSREARSNFQEIEESALLFEAERKRNLAKLLTP